MHRTGGRGGTAVWTRIETCRDFFVKASLTFFDQIILPIKTQIFRKGLSVVPGGMSVIFGGYYWFSAVGGQERSKYGPEWALRIYIYEIFF